MSNDSNLVGFVAQGFSVLSISNREAADLVVKHHYLRRKPPISYAAGLIDECSGDILGCVTFGNPASRNMLISACQNPKLVIELNRLWVHDDLPRNTETWFLSRVLRIMQPRIILSYADTSAGHVGYVYRAANFHYAGWTDMDRKTPRFDYVSPGKHSRDAFRNGYTEKVRRKPKVKYWTVTGDRYEKRWLEKQCLWPKLNWKTRPPPSSA